MSKITLIAKLTAVPGKEAEVEQALRDAVEASVEEPGLEIYSAHAAHDEPGVYYYFSVYADQAARDVHAKGEQMMAAKRAFYGLVTGWPEVTLMSPIAAKGLDL